jgi:CRISPR-associated protein Cas2
MDILVTYDVNTETKEGRRRLRKVATVCKDYGQRVQLSVFECRVNDSQYEILRDRLVKTMDPTLDSIRVYRLPAPREEHLFCFGIDGLLRYNRSSHRKCCTQPLGWVRIGTSGQPIRDADGTMLHSASGLGEDWNVPINRWHSLALAVALSLWAG